MSQNHDFRSLYEDKEKKYQVLEKRYFEESSSWEKEKNNLLSLIEEIQTKFNMSELMEIQEEYNEMKLRFRISLQKNSEYDEEIKILKNNIDEMTKQLEMKNKMELELRQEMNNLAQMNSNLKEENSFFKLTPLGTLKSKHEKELYAIHEKTKEQTHDLKIKTQELSDLEKISEFQKEKIDVLEQQSEGRGDIYENLHSHHDTQLREKDKIIFDQKLKIKQLEKSLDESILRQKEIEIQISQRKSNYELKLVSKIENQEDIIGEFRKEIKDLENSIRKKMDPKKMKFIDRNTKRLEIQIELLEEELENSQQLIVVIQKLLKGKSIEPNMKNEMDDENMEEMIENVNYVKLTRKLVKKFKSFQSKIEQQELKMSALKQQNIVAQKTTEVQNIYDLKIFENLRQIVMPFVDDEQFKKLKYDHKTLNIKFTEIWEHIEKERHKNKNLITELRKELKKLMGRGQKEDEWKRKSRNAELKAQGTLKELERLKVSLERYKSRPATDELEKQLNKTKILSAQYLRDLETKKLLLDANEKELKEVRSKLADLRASRKRESEIDFFKKSNAKKIKIGFFETNKNSSLIVNLNDDIGKKESGYLSDDTKDLLHCLYPDQTKNEMISLEKNTEEKIKQIEEQHDQQVKSMNKALKEMQNKFEIVKRNEKRNKLIEIPDKIGLKEMGKENQKTFDVGIDFLKGIVIKGLDKNEKKEKVKQKKNKFKILKNEYQSLASPPSENISLIKEKKREKKKSFLEMLKQRRAKRKMQNEQINV